jgi:hypothetical protein
MPNEAGLEILRFMKMRSDTAHETGNSSVVELDELVEHFQLPRIEMRDQCLLLETERYIQGSHSLGADPNPAFLITDWGKKYVIENN